MSGFENYRREADDIEREIALLGVALGIDWSDTVTVRELARAAFDCRLGQGIAECDQQDPAALARIKLFGMAQLMLTVMRESADHGIHTHGGPIWKSFGKALWDEAQSRREFGIAQDQGRGA